MKNPGEGLPDDLPPSRSQDTFPSLLPINQWIRPTPCESYHGFIRCPDFGAGGRGRFSGPGPRAGSGASDFTETFPSGGDGGRPEREISSPSVYPETTGGAEILFRAAPPPPP